MSLNIELFAQYGITGIALYLMYRITSQHLTTIEKKLDRIVELLSSQP